MELTQQALDTLKQNLRHKYIKLQILDDDYKIVDSIEGYTIGGSLNYDATNPIRRSGSVEMVVPINQQATQLLDELSGYTVAIGGKIWIDKKIKILVGIKNFFRNEIEWYNMGVYLIDQPQRTKNATDYTLSFQCVDLMTKLTESRQGQLTGLGTIIEKGYYETKIESGQEVTTYIKNELAEVLANVLTELGGITKFSIYPIPEVYRYLPYDIKIGVGGTVLELLTEIMNIIPTWEMFFDKEGVFTIAPIPSGEDAIVYELFDEQRITDDMNIDFANVKNQVVIYGRLNELTYYTENTEDEPDNVDYVENKLILKYSAINTDALTIAGTTFGFKNLDEYNENYIDTVEIYSGGELILSSSLVKFENAATYLGVDYNTSRVEKDFLTPSEIFYIRILDATLTKNSDDIEIVDISQPVTFEFMGKQQVSYSLVNDNKESAFYINASFKDNNYYAGTAYCDSDSKIGENYLLTLNNDNSLTSLKNGDIITFIPNYTNTHNDDGFTSVTIKAKNGTTLESKLPLVQNLWVQENGVYTRPYVQENKLTNDYTIWQIVYEEVGDNKWLVLKGRHPYAFVSVLSDGEFNNIYSDQLAYERSLYELFYYSNLNDTITISCVPNYLIDANCKFSYNPNSALPNNVFDSQPYKVKIGETDNHEQFKTLSGEDFYVKYNEFQFFVAKNISFPLDVGSTTQTITGCRIYDSGNLLGKIY